MVRHFPHDGLYFRQRIELEGLCYFLADGNIRFELPSQFPDKGSGGNPVNE
jgi:hypothetical protein